MSNTPEAIVLTSYDAINNRELDAFEQLFSADVTMNGEPSSPAEIRGYCGAYVAAFEDLKVTVENSFAAGEWVATRLTTRGTHTAELEGLPATGKTMEIAQHDLTRVQDGRITEVWTVFDQLGMLQQLGVAAS